MNWTCTRCGEEQGSLHPDLINHIRLFHPDEYEQASKALLEALRDEG